MKFPQVALREVFLLVVIAAMGYGWWWDRSRLSRRVWLLEWERTVEDEGNGVQRLWREDIEADLERLGYVVEVQDRQGRARHTLVPK